MTKHTLLTLGLGVALAAAVGFAGCAKQAGPLSPNTNLIGVGSVQATRLPQVSAFSPRATSYTLTDTHSKVFVTFNTAMDSTSFTTSSVKVYSLYHVNGTVPYDDESEVTNITFSYDAATQQLTIMHGNGAWPTNTSYRVLLTNSIRSVTGRPLDGNSNGIAESNDFDAYTDKFDVGTPTTTGAFALGAYTLSKLNITSNETSTNDLYDVSAGSTVSTLANVISSPSYVTITVTFSDMYDAASMNDNAGKLLTNASTGALVSPVNIVVGPAGTTFGAVYQLDPSTRYKITLYGGLSGFRSTTVKPDAGAPLFGRYFDGNRSKGAEATDNFVTYISTAAADQTSQPTVTVGTVSYASRVFTVPFVFNHINTGSDRLDTSTLTNSNFQLMVVSPGNYAVTPKRIVYDGYHTVEVYLPDSFYPNNSGTEVSMQVRVLNGIRSVGGVALDGDGDDIIEPNDDYTSGLILGIPSQK